MKVCFLCTCKPLLLSAPLCSFLNLWPILTLEKKLVLDPHCNWCSSRYLVSCTPSWCWCLLVGCGVIIISLFIVVSHNMHVFYVFPFKQRHYTSVYIVFSGNTGASAGLLDLIKTVSINPVDNNNRECGLLFSAFLDTQASMQ